VNGQMLTADQVAEMVGVSRQTVIKRAKAGDLAYHDFGTYRFELTDVENWIKSHRVVAVKKNDPATTGSKRK
jgi:excisionase family DNA binding protein